MSDIGPALGSLGLALVVVWVMTPIAGRAAWRVGAIDRPRARGLHQFPTPRLGGLAVLVGVLAAGLTFLPLNTQTYGILGGAVVIALLLAFDDLLELPADVKLLAQVLAALVPVACGVLVEDFTLPFIGRVELGDLAYPATILGIVAVMNIVNFIDGVDGLAAGICMIAALTLGTIALSLDRTTAGILAALTAGAALGYLRHGFHPATVFLGDSGSNLLGYLLAVIAVQGALKTNAVVALIFPLVILAVPILDSGFVIAKRVKYGRPVYRADNWHFHHRFANIGFSQRKTVAYLYAWTVALAALALALRFVPYSDDRGNFDLEWTLVICGFGLLAVAASFYLVFVLEILKLRRFRGVQLRREHQLQGEPEPSQSEVDAEVAAELETGEFEAVRPPDRAG